ncbi:hypothetical protein PAAG_04783 [Paracoccidioides lutzii Pb01]|uniref:C2H2-type domain-containing protein n=1 Tax=Paracoccidioides lutzii (strain ATCC MYA-826 / Pb01) TaxID=502779 RepID=C1H2F4_PARBA|nr:hypothetical protein PAAG_04783 [Paracoccidioides lutzii Pb01]EEH33734.2 hypothetical protein PAAG_04783 [Paracoccidioides lutzii Pb01]
MLALEHSRHKQSYLPQLSMDPSMHDPFGPLYIDSYSPLGSYNLFPAGSTSFSDAPSFQIEAPHHPYNNSSNSAKYEPFAHHNCASPTIVSIQASDFKASTASSSASGPSLPSTSSSTIGSPYQESWIDMNSSSGLGPATVGSDGYSQEYVSAAMDANMMFAHEKLPDSFVDVAALSGNNQQHMLSMSPPSSTVPLKGRRSRMDSGSRTSRHLGALGAPITRSLSGEYSPSLYSPGLLLSRKRSLTQASDMASAVHARKMSTAESKVKCRDNLPSSRSSQSPLTSSRYRERFENCFFNQSSGNFVPPPDSSYPSLINPPMQQQSSYPPPTVSYAEESQYAFAQSPAFMPASPAASPLPQPQTLHHPHHPHSALPSPFLNQSGFPSRPVSFTGRRSSISSENSRRSRHSPLAGSVDYEEEGKEKGRCPHPDCRRVFKDLKAHMLTHQSERPEKCPILTCEYHLKGFARKYDKNRHTLTHYKGTMVCGFCPGSGSAAEKSFNRADVFKRHLTSVHGVEQTAPNSRKKSPPTANRKASSFCNDATGKCSTCSSTFNNAQEFYEHLDDCVLRVVQQEEPSEAINLKRLTEVASDDAVRQTMEKHMLIDTGNDLMTKNNNNPADENDDDLDDSNDSNNMNTKYNSAGQGSRKPPSSPSHSSNPSSASNTLQKSTTITPSGISKTRPTVSRRRNNRNNYPQSWGCPTNKMKMKKRVLCLYDGQHRLWKDEMMLDNEFEVRLKLLGGVGANGAGSSSTPGRDAYVTDLDVETLKRAEGVHGATEEERGVWDAECLPVGSAGLMGPAAVPMLVNGQDGGLVDEVDIEELMA